MNTNTDPREQIRSHYAAVATALTTAAPRTDPHDGDSCCGGSCCDGAPAERAIAGHTAEDSCCDSSCCGGGTGESRFGADLYEPASVTGLPARAVAASLGSGDPTAIVDLKEGERVLDLGSGGGVDVLLSAGRVGPSGFAYGVDMTDEMLDLARANAAEAGVSNVEFLKGTVEDVPLPDGSVDIVMSNCVVNLSVDKPATLAEMFRVLRPGGRIGVSDVVAEDHLSSAERADHGSVVGCVSGALSRSEYVDGLEAAGFTAVDVEFTHRVADGMYAATIRATKPPSATAP